MKISIFILLLTCLACQPREPIDDSFPPSRIPQNLENGNDYMLLSDWKRASAKFQEVLEEDSAHPAALYQKAYLCELQGDLHGAINNYTTALANNPMLVMAYYRRANCHKALQEISSATADYNKVLELKPDFINVLTELAYLQSGSEHNYERTLLTLLNQAIAKKESDVLYQFRGVQKYHLKDPQGALADFAQALKINSDNAEAHFYRGVLLGDKADYRSAVQHLSKAIQLNGNKSAYLYRGIYLYNLNELDKACSDFHTAHSLGESTAQKYQKEYCK